MVGIVVVSHSREIAAGTVAPRRARWRARTCASRAPAARPTAASAPTPTACATRSTRPTRATASSCSATSAARSSPSAPCSPAGENGHVRLADAPLVEGAVAAAVTASAGLGLDDVARAAKEARGAAKL